LARQSEDLVYSPHIQLLDESDNFRQGFVNPAEFVKLHDNLPGYLKPIEFLYLTGMRSGASKKLEHRHVDLEAQVIRLPIELSKNEKGLTIPLSGRLLLLVESAWNNRSLECLHHKGEPIGDFRKAFDSAATAAGITELLPHDLRRSAIRNLVRAGVKETVAMRLSGHRTRSVFDRYNIVSEDEEAQGFSRGSSEGEQGREVKRIVNNRESSGHFFGDRFLSRAVTRFSLTSFHSIATPLVLRLL
jgi:integrase